MLAPLFSAALWLAADARAYEVQERTRSLTTEQMTFSSDTVAPGDEATINVYLASTGDWPVQVYAIDLEVTEGDPGAWTLLDTWKTEDEDGDGAPDYAEIDAGSEEDPSYHLVELVWRPGEPGASRGVLRIVSNDTEVTERVEIDGNEYGVWRVAVRGFATPACATVWPLWQDLGPLTTGQTATASVTVESCGPAPWTLEGLTIEGSDGFEEISGTPTRLDAQGAQATVIIRYTAPSEDPALASVLLSGLAPELDTPVEIEANRSADPSADELDGDGDGFSPRAGDCDDADERIYPGAEEEYDTVDNNCDGVIDEYSYAADDDRDGYSEVAQDGSTEDCHDADPFIWPGAPEDCDETDNDCDGLIDEGEDDSADGACDWVVQRQVSEVSKGEARCGCGSAAPRSGWTLLAALALWRRTPSRRAGRALRA